MKTIITTIIILLVAAAGSPADATRCVDGVRVFADVLNAHPFCEEIESMYRDGLTSGCRVENGERYFCPDAVVTRGLAAAFVQYRDPFAQINFDGRIMINDHVVDAMRVSEGVYHVQFSRDVQFCSREGWSQDFMSDALRVRVTRLSPTIDTVKVRTTLNGSPIDLRFNVRLHCR